MCYKDPLSFPLARKKTPRYLIVMKHELRITVLNRTNFLFFLSLLQSTANLAKHSVLGFIEFTRLNQIEGKSVYTHTDRAL